MAARSSTRPDDDGGRRDGDVLPGQRTHGDRRREAPGQLGSERLAIIEPRRIGVGIDGLVGKEGLGVREHRCPIAAQPEHERERVAHGRVVVNDKDGQAL